MGKFVAGDVVVIPFPFSDLSGRKSRPALVLAQADHTDLILCQITSRAYASSNAMILVARDFKEGNLPLTSFVRPDKLFTAEASIIQKRRGTVLPQRFNSIARAVRSQFKNL